MDPLTDIRQLLIEECREDDVGLWVLIWHLERAFPEKTEGEIRSVTLELATQLLHVKGIRAGQFNEKGVFEYWEGTPNEIIARIRKEWDMLGKTPDIGDIMWFVPK